MEVANTNVNMTDGGSNTTVNTSSSINSSSSGSSTSQESPTNTSSYQTNTTGNTYDVEEIDLSASEEEGFLEQTGKKIDNGLAAAGSAISSGLSAIGGFFSDLGKSIVDTGAKVASNVKSWVSDRIADLKGIGATLAETASNVASNVSSLLRNFGSWVTKTALPAVGTALKKTGASIGNVVTGLIQGVGQFGEALVDTCAIVRTGVASAFTGLYDFGQFVVGKITGNENWHSVTKDMWSSTMEFVQKEHVNEAFKKFHENSPLGKWLDENAYAPFKSDGTGYKIVNGVGYIAGIIALTIATMGIGTAVSGGAAAASGATVAASSNVINIGSMATIEITKQSIISGGIAAAAGLGKNTEAAWNDGAGLGGGLAYGAAKGLWEGVEMFLGASINSLKLANLGGGAVVQQLATTGAHVALDTIDGASASFIDPLMQMIYNPNETNMEEIMHIVNFDENGNQISNKTWDDLSFTEKYDALFKYHGGWQGVMTAAGSAAAMSFLTEIPDIRKAVKGTNTIETIAATTGAGAAGVGATKSAGTSDATTTSSVTDANSGAAKSAMDGSEGATSSTAETAAKAVDTGEAAKKVTQMTEEEIHASIKSEIDALDKSAPDYAKKVALLEEKEALEVELSKKMAGVVETGATTKSIDLLTPEQQAQVKIKAQEVFDAATAKEPKVKALMESMTGDGASLAGLGHDIKSVDSIQEKIARLMQKGYDLQGAVDEVNDSLRYTFILDASSYGDDVLQRVAFLKSQGFEPLYVNNSWGNSTYQGLNITFAAKDGSLMEVQFHTQASFDVKDSINHEFYEISRSTAVDSETKDIANRIQQINQSVHGETVNFTPQTVDQINKAIENRMKALIEIGALMSGEDPVETAKRINPDAAAYKSFSDYAKATAADEAVWRQRIQAATYTDPITGKTLSYEDLVNGYIGENAGEPGCYFVLNSVNRAMGENASATLENLYLRDAAGNIITDAQGRRAIVFYGCFGSKHVYYHDMLTDELIPQSAGDAIKVNGRNITYSELLTKVEAETKALNDAISMNPHADSTIIGRGTGWNALEKYGIKSTDSAEEIAAKLTKYGSEPVYFDDGFMSSTPEMGGGFMYDDGVNFIMTTKEGKPLGNFSYYNSWEQEVLVPAGSKFRVTGVKKSSSGQGVYIYLTQE